MGPVARRATAAVVTAAALAALVVVSTGPALAQVPPVGTTTTTTSPSTTTTSAPPPPPSTTTPGPTLLPRPTTTTTGARSGPTTTTTVAPPEGGGPGSAPSGPATAIGPVPNFVRSAPNDTGALLDALADLEAFGLTPQETALVGMGHFPIAGFASWSDDWQAPRYTPTFHLHQGNDIFAAGGTPVLAPADGVLRYQDEAVGGLSAYVTIADGTYFYMAHLSAFVAGLASGVSVHVGQVVGFVGNTGDAAGGATHCHFEIHPQGGAAVDPKATLDAWVAEALARVPLLVNAYESAAPRVLLTTGQTRRYDVGDDEFAAPGLPPAAPMAWASSVSPAGSALRLVEAEVAGQLASLDWSRRARQQAALARAWQRGGDEARWVLQPLAPRLLQPLLGSDPSASGS